MKVSCGEFFCNYANDFKRSHFLSELKIFFKKNEKKMHLLKVSVCGRVFRKRVMGGASFFEIRDISGKIQLYISKNKFKKKYKQLISYLSLGDIIGVSGSLFNTKTKELSLDTSCLKVLSKNYNLFPDKQLGLLDKETCCRYRYVDLMVNDDTKKRFIMRSKIISEIRLFFLNLNYLEVETPIIQSTPGGADAKPFTTYHNYLNTDLHLRISPELYLKRLIIGGFEKIFEIGKNFRNEGVSLRHHPEFTMIEFYQTYSCYKDLMSLTEKLLNYLINFFFKKNTLVYNNVLLDFSLGFRKINFIDSILKYANISKKQLFNKDFLLNMLKMEYKIEMFDLKTIGEFQFKLFEKVVEKQLIQPTFVLHHPVDVSPLAKKMDCNNTLVERFELYIHGKEIANGFSELNNPEDQISRFLSQKKAQQEFYDKDYINALKYGLPPTAGEGIGIDRLVMLLTNSTSIKDVILFPLMKDK